MIVAKKVDLDARYKMPPDARARLGAMIRDLRVANKLTQSGLGGIEADAAAISRIERARQGITLDTLWTIAMRLRVPVFTLVAYSEGQISSRQMRIIQAYEGADDEQRGMLLIFARQLAAEIIHSAPNVLPFKLAGQTRPRADI